MFHGPIDFQRLLNQRRINFYVYMIRSIFDSSERIYFSSSFEYVEG